ncbi:MAG TPA: helix-turn-helix transcriptional regulator [Phycisphaerae bacterium]|jgi:transcriptional regulator|nr:PadR family transcriptional regulator [Phycisphaerae bacterium]HOB74244.1 helix-turn-helix transcriptional regulator [Phycisphaerae bacterium]HOJ53164.1 helix-turn-helix transcriptional regulator [Phycisphaerae bacterium]HOL24901.1 helix-turn-helix transcriptional regulator [Phycisphaerae bacterium]HPP19437.1 helix-turn-helix transcriptional regulator [Phycisphaerae bacterium]
MTFDRDLVRGSLDLMVLSALAEGPQYGYLIQKRIREASGNLVRIQAGTLYPLLHRLESDGAITSRWDDTTGRDRKWYELTPTGRRMLQDQASQWQEYVNCIRRLLNPALAALRIGPEPT